MEMVGVTGEEADDLRSLRGTVEIRSWRRRRRRRRRRRWPGRTKRKKNRRRRRWWRIKEPEKNKKKIRRRRKGSGRGKKEIEEEELEEYNIHKKVEDDDEDEDCPNPMMTLSSRFFILMFCVVLTEVSCSLYIHFTSVVSHTLVLDSSVTGAPDVKLPRSKVPWHFAVARLRQQLKNIKLLSSLGSKVLRSAVA